VLVDVDLSLLALLLHGFCQAISLRVEPYPDACATAHTPPVSGPSALKACRGWSLFSLVEMKLFQWWGRV
jgi:hypothetical protein